MNSKIVKLLFPSLFKSFRKPVGDEKPEKLMDIVFENVPIFTSNETVKLFSIDIMNDPLLKNDENIRLKFTCTPERDYILKSILKGMVR